MSGRNRTFSMVQSSPGDHAAIGEYLAQHAWPGPVELVTLRAEDFTLLYRAQTPDFETHLIKDELGRIHGMFSILFKEGFIEEEMSRYAMVSDLRVSPTGPALRALIQNFLPVALRSLQIRNVDKLFCVVSPAQEHLLGALLRPRQNLLSSHRFALVRRFNIVAIHGRKPMAKPFNSVVIRQAKDSDRAALIEYLRKESRQRLLGEDYSADLLKKQVENWKGLHLQDFQLACDDQGNIRGTVALWNPKDLQLFKVKRFRGIGRTAASTLRWLPRLGLGASLPRKNECFDLKFLTHLQADNVDIFEALLNRSLLLKERSELLIYANFEDHILSLPPLSMITTRIPLSLFTLISPSQELPTYLRFNLQTPGPDIEPALL